MSLDFLTREIFDALIIAVIMIGAVLAFFRLRQDFTRPLADENDEYSDYLEPFDDEHEEHIPS